MADPDRDDGTKGPRMSKRTRSRDVHIYLKPGMTEDDLLLAVWDAEAMKGRSQPMFRRLLLEGFKRMIERGEMPKALLEDRAVERHMGAVGEVTRHDPAPRLVVMAGPATHDQRPYPPAHQPQTAPPRAFETAPPAPAFLRDESRPAEPPKPAVRKGLDPNLM